MSESQLSTPVALVIFNRPETTARVWEAIREARPKTLFVIADGPRAGRLGEAERCAEVRAICEQVDWPCEVLRNYAEINLGCRERPKTGWDWVFENVEGAILLEDDCLPHPTFFRFCQEMLERYRDDERVMCITGDNFQPSLPRTDYSYYFSRFPNCWGWASWRRAWQHYDVNISLWPTIRDGGWLNDMLGEARAVAFWEKILQLIADKKLNTCWDYQFTFACLCQSGLTIAPRTNLVSNIGFGPGATHTVGDSIVGNLPTVGLSFPLYHPPYVIADSRADSNTAKMFFSSPRIAARVIHRMKSLVRRIIGPLSRTSKSR